MDENQLSQIIVDAAIRSIARWVALVCSKVSIEGL